MRGDAIEDGDEQQPGSPTEEVAKHLYIFERNKHAFNTIIYTFYRSEFYCEQLKCRHIIYVIVCLVEIARTTSF